MRIISNRVLIYVIGVALLLIGNKDVVYAGSFEEGELTQKAWLNRALLAAAGMDDRKQVAMALEKGADVNVLDPLHSYDRTPPHFTPLMMAAWYNYYEIACFLITHKADVNKAGINGLTPLIEACSHGHEKMVELLLENNADINAETQGGHSALTLAAANNHYQLIKTLISRGSYCNIEEWRWPLSGAMSESVLKERYAKVCNCLGEQDWYPDEIVWKPYLPPPFLGKLILEYASPYCVPVRAITDSSSELNKAACSLLNKLIREEWAKRCVKRNAQKNAINVAQARISTIMSLWFKST